LRKFHPAKTFEEGALGIDSIPEDDLCLTYILFLLKNNSFWEYSCS